MTEMGLEKSLRSLADVRAPSALGDGVMQEIKRERFSVRTLVLYSACFGAWIFTVQGVITWTTAQL